MKCILSSRAQHSPTRNNLTQRRAYEPKSSLYPGEEDSIPYNPIPRLSLFLSLFISSFLRREQPTVTIADNQKIKKFCTLTLTLCSTFNV